MRFGKRTKSRLVPRREVTTPEDPDVRPVQTPERDALLFQDSPEIAGDASLERGAPTPAGDPTQRLLTALGRFHRYVAKGQAGAPQEFWSDDCMNHLLEGVELALRHDWPSIVDALTGTARLLQSYENAGSAHLCIPFLNESYEVLCLMVGDLIVNNVRSGVMDKWRERYDRAVADLLSAGFTLVADDREVKDARAGVSPKETPAPRLAEAGAAEDEVVPDILPFPPPESPEPVAEEARAAEPAIDAFPPGEPEPVEELAPALAGTGGESELDEADLPHNDPEVINVLDSLCEDLARVEQAAPEGGHDTLASVARKVLKLEQYAERRDLLEPERVCRRMREVCEYVSKNERAPDDRFFDVAYAFCETFVRATRAPKDETVQAWQADTEALLDRLQGYGVAAPEAEPSPPEPKPVTEAVPEFMAALETTEEPETEAEPEAMTSPEPQQAAEPEAPAPAEAGDSPESLLVTAQQAVARGNIAGAKAMALQAVAHLARAETAKAEARVQGSELRFKQNAEEIERARSQVKRAEQEVIVAEGRVAEGGAELADARAHTALVEERVQSVERRIEEIEEQIRALQTTLEAEQERAKETQAELDAARQQEQDGERQLETLKEGEQAARAALEESRQNVKDLQRNRLELEEVLSRARETLTHHRASMADIERTIAQIRPLEGAPETPPEELLF